MRDARVRSPFAAAVEGKFDRSADSTSILTVGPDTESERERESTRTVQRFKLFLGAVTGC